MATHPTALHLCTGYAGFEIALKPYGIQTVGHIERDSYAATILMERMEQKRLDQAPIWDCLETFDGEPWRGRVDIITAGFPCQPFSNAGTKQRTHDDRWLWPSLARIIREIQPRNIILENVPNIIRHGLPEILHDLTQLRFDAEWALYSAADIGAPHQRQRFWLVANTNRDGQPQIRRQPQRQQQPRRNTHRRNSTPMANPPIEGLPQRHQQPRPNQPEIPQPPQHHTPMGNPFPPTRDNPQGWAEWTAQGGPQPILRRSTNGPPLGLADALHLGGNGLVPQCATEAIRQLLHRANWTLT